MSLVLVLLGVLDGWRSRIVFEMDRIAEALVIILVIRIFASTLRE